MVKRVKAPGQETRPAARRRAVPPKNGAPKDDAVRAKAYELFERHFDSPRWAVLADHGARVSSAGVTVPAWSVPPTVITNGSLAGAPIGDGVPSALPLLPTAATTTPATSGPPSSAADAQCPRRKNGETRNGQNACSDVVRGTTAVPPPPRDRGHPVRG